MKTKQEITNRIEELKKNFKGSDDYLSGVNDGMYQLMNDLLDEQPSPPRLREVIEEMEDEIKRMNEIKLEFPTAHAVYGALLRYSVRLKSLDLPTSSLKWVRASERLPSNSGYYFVRMNSQQEKHVINKTDLHYYASKPALDCEWLDESAPTTEPLPDAGYREVIKYLMKASDLIEGFGEKETSEFNRNIYFTHVGNLTEAIRTLEHYRFDESPLKTLPAKDDKQDEIKYPEWKHLEGMTEDQKNNWWKEIHRINKII